MSRRPADDLWDTALGQLELQVTRPNFETWLRNTTGLRYEADTLIVGVPSDFALEWLRRSPRIGSLINHAVAQLASGVSVIFEVIGVHQAPATQAPSANGHMPTPTPAPTGLNRRLTFESLAVVESNRLAFNAAQQFASGGAAYDLLVLSGPAGTGKSHLLHAIGHKVARAGRRVVLISAEAFVDKFSTAVQAGRPQTFRAAFEDCELFLLDDLHLLTTRPGSLRQLSHMLDRLSTESCAVALASDTAPAKLPGLSSRLRSRLQAGLVVDLGSPSPADRLAILKAKASGLANRPADSILTAIAALPGDNIHQLEGSLHRVVAYQDLTGEPVTPTTLSAALKPLAAAPPRSAPASVLDKVGSRFGLTTQQLSGPSRSHDIAYARHLAMYLLREHGHLPLTHIGQLLGGRDHSTVLYGCRRIHRDLKTYPQTKADLQQIEAALRESEVA